MGENEYKVDAYKFIPPVSVGLFVVGYVIFGVLLQFPSNHEMVGRLVDAGMYEMAWEELQKADEKDRKALPGIYRQYEILLAIQLNKPLEIGYYNGFKEILKVYHELRYPKQTLQVLKQVVTGLKEPRKTYDILLKTFQDPNFIGKEELLITLRNYSLSMNFPSLSADIMRFHLLDKPPYTLDEFQEILSYYRFDSAHEKAYEWFQQSYGNIEDIENSEISERVDYISEFLTSVGRTKEAFDYLHAHVDYVVEAEDVKMFDQYVSLGVQIQEFRKITKAYEMKLSLAKDPEVGDVLKFVDILIQGGNQEKARLLLKDNYEDLTLDYKKKLANLYEWSDQSKEAFDIYILLLVNYEDYTVLDRLLELNNGLFRHLELASAILSVDCFTHAPDNHRRIAELFDKVGMYDEAIDFYKSYLSNHPSDDEPLLNIAQMYRTVHRFEEMAISLEQYLRRVGGERRVDVLVLLAEAYRYTNQYEKAEQIYRELQSRDKSFRFIRSLIRIAELEDKMEEYYYYLKESIDHYETSTAYEYWIIANYFVRLKDDETAIRYLSKGVERFSQNVEIRDYLLSLLFQYNRNEEALELLDTHPQKLTNKDVLSTFLNILMNEKQYERIAETLSLVDMDIFTNDPDMEGFLAYYYQQTGQKQKFKDFAKQLYETYPGSVEFLKQYGFSLAEDQNYKKAWEVFDKMENPGKDVLINMSLFAYRMKEKKMALDYALKALSRAGSLSHMEYGYIGDLYLDLGDRDMASLFYNKAVQKLLKNIKLP